MEHRAALPHNTPTPQPLPDTTPEGVPVPPFTPYAPLRERGRGWSAQVQRAFIFELTRIGSVRAAAQAVGRSARSVYLLREKAGAESFAAAWDAALEAGRGAAHQAAISRALHGELVPRFRGGRFMGFDLRQNDRMLIAAIAGQRSRDPSIEDERAAQDEMRYRLQRWEDALRREAMEREGGPAAAMVAKECSAAEAWDDHVVWKREMAREARRQRNAEIRAAVKRGMAVAAKPPPEPRVRTL